MIPRAMELAERFDRDGLTYGEFSRLLRLARALGVSVDDLREATR